jgi:hypothetical protein
MKRVLGAVASVVTESAKTQKNSGRDLVFRREQWAMANLIEEVRHLKGGFENCEKTHRRDNTTDISPED